MQRLFNLDKWTTIPEGKAMNFDTDRPRVIRLDVNSSGPSNLYVMMRDDADKADAEAHFLARIDGRDVIEFVTPGAFALVCDGEPVSLYSVDGDVWTYSDPSPEIFTRIHERRARNPELEFIVAKMQQNMERRLATQAEELGRLIERRRAAEAALPPPPGDDRSAGDKPEAPEGAATGGGDKAPKRGRKDTGRRDDEE